MQVACAPPLPHASASSSSAGRLPSRVAAGPVDHCAGCCSATEAALRGGRGLACRNSRDRAVSFEAKSSAALMATRDRPGGASRAQTRAWIESEAGGECQCWLPETVAAASEAGEPLNAALQLGKAGLRGECCPAAGPRTGADARGIMNSPKVARIGAVVFARRFLRAGHWPLSALPGVSLAGARALGNESVHRLGSRRCATTLGARPERSARVWLC
jgi:hypothetical protein